MGVFYAACDKTKESIFGNRDALLISRMLNVLFRRKRLYQMYLVLSMLKKVIYLETQQLNIKIISEIKYCQDKHSHTVTYRVFSFERIAFYFPLPAIDYRRETSVSRYVVHADRNHSFQTHNLARTNRFKYLRVLCGVLRHEMGGATWRSYTCIAIAIFRQL